MPLCVGMNLRYIIEQISILVMKEGTNANRVLEIYTERKDAKNSFSTRTQRVTTAFFR